MIEERLKELKNSKRFYFQIKNIFPFIQNTFHDLNFKSFDDYLRYTIQKQLNSDEDNPFKYESTFKECTKDINLGIQRFLGCNTIFNLRYHDQSEGCYKNIYYYPYSLGNSTYAIGNLTMDVLKSYFRDNQKFLNHKLILTNREITRDILLQNHSYSHKEDIVYLNSFKEAKKRIIDFAMPTTLIIENDFIEKSKIRQFFEEINEYLIENQYKFPEKFNYFINGEYDLNDVNYINQLIDNNQQSSIDEICQPKKNLIKKVLKLN